MAGDSRNMILYGKVWAVYNIPEDATWKNDPIVTQQFLNKETRLVVETRVDKLNLAFQVIRFLPPDEKAFGEQENEQKSSSPQNS